jgi:hypothetical protein
MAAKIRISNGQRAVVAKDHNKRSGLIQQPSRHAIGETVKAVALARRRWVTPLKNQAGFAMGVNETSPNFSRIASMNLRFMGRGHG